MSKLALIERSLMVRIARKELNYCVGLEIQAPSQETMALMNQRIASFFESSHTTTIKSLSAKEVEWRRDGRSAWRHVVACGGRERRRAQGTRGEQ
jgi:hypothetical protein